MIEAKSKTLPLSVFCLSVVGLVAFVMHKNKVIRELKELLKHEVDKREADRKGRIQAERLLASRARVVNAAEGHLMDYIGVIESPFPDRRGTPRQPMLVPAAHGRIKFDRKVVQAEAFQELKEFSHIFVIFVFHENTNIDKGARGKGTEKRGPPSKIAPPRLGGKRVGCLTTRSPHRPNPIGLSVCQVLGVGDDYVDISSVDFVHGTPVLDIKPVVPYDLVPSKFDLTNLLMAKDQDGRALQQRELEVPSWIIDSDIPMRQVIFTPEAEESLRSVVSKKGMRFCDSFEHGRDLIVQVLRQDVRGVHQGRSDKATKSARNGNGDEAGAGGETYMCRLDSLEIQFGTTADQVIVRQLGYYRQQHAGK